MTRILRITPDGWADPVSYALRRYSRRARRITSEVVTPSLVARSSAAARRLGSSRTDSTAFAAAPSGGRPRPRGFSRSCPASYPLSASSASVSIIASSMGRPLLVFPYVRFVMGSHLRTVRLGCSLAAPWHESQALHPQDREQRARGDCPPDSVLQEDTEEGHRQASPRRWNVRTRERCRRRESDDAVQTGGSPLIKCSTEIPRVNRRRPPIVTPSPRYPRASKENNGQLR